MLAPSDLSSSQTIDRHPLTVPPETLVSEVVTLMSKARASCVLVTQQQKLVGIFTERDVVKITAAGKALADVEIAAVMTKQLITLPESAANNALSVVSMLRQHRIRHLPVVNELQELIGIATPQSIRDILQPADLLKLRLVADVMTNEVVKASITASVFDLAQLMATHQVSCVVIVNDDTQQNFIPLGIVTERDIVQLQAIGVDFTSVTAETVMSTPLLPTKKSETLWFANQQMTRYRIRRLVVVGDDGQLAGIVTQSSLLQIFDPLEMLESLNALQQLVEERTSELQIVNEKLHSEVIQRQQAQIALQHQMSSERLMGAIATRIRQSLNLEEILNTTVHEVRQFLGCDRVLLYQILPNGTGMVVTEAVNSGWKPILGQVFSPEVFPEEYHQQYVQGRISATADVENDEVLPCLIEFLQNLQVKAKLVVPIIKEEQLWGLLIAHHCSETREWQQLEIDLLEQLGTHIAIALKQSQLYQQVQTELIERQRAEEKLKQLAILLQQANDELELRVDQRTTELQHTLAQLQTEISERKRAEAELAKALEKEKELSTLKSRFVTIASHEFRTPLAIILVASELLKNYGHKFDENKKNKQFNKIKTAVQQTTNLLDELLLISKTASGRIEFNPQPLNIEEFCRDILEETELIQGLKHTFRFDCQGECVNVEIDEKLLRQMLTNLLSNAVKYSPNGGNIHFHLACEDQQVTFQIQDQGIGIPVTDRERLFEIFHRGSNIGDIPGTGLGNTIIKNAVEAHGGMITIESEVDVGTTFTVSLPTSQVRGEISCNSPVEPHND
ncbi:multi-sensor signal transduction histidine kinase [Crinalium epipsammum PCC 9333]|uniref:histidine kinase n=1 Tax=Crinalium epipsammum PCC 9333 TaxID=1173022 RepID=K9VW71_9CYAN|nr:CBS domain-containing protein [Crinalium epipsammum]AFZ11732.1 multi-sensor signal transduction histidine kinase [Crinalium epipsammum PCC 9333]